MKTEKSRWSLDMHDAITTFSLDPQVLFSPPFIEFSRWVWATILNCLGPLGNVETKFQKNSSYVSGRLVIAWMVAIRSIIEVVFSLMFLTQPSALESFNATLTVNTPVSLLFDVCLSYPSSVTKLKGVVDKGYVKATARSITLSFEIEKASKDRRMFWLTSTVAWTCFNFTMHFSRDLNVFTLHLVSVSWHFAVWLVIHDLKNSSFILVPFWRTSRIVEAKSFATSSPCRAPDMSCD